MYPLRSLTPVRTWEGHSEASPAFEFLRSSRALVALSMLGAEGVPDVRNALPKKCHATAHAGNYRADSPKIIP
ncbi:MAG: hypothetical protein M5R41_18035 [Bacteroidia bacterium]|nr:hypothetical protein [Bacteroidia bacterium]